MFRILLFLLLVLPLALGFAYVADQPGSITVTVAGRAYETSLVVGLVGIAVLGLSLMLLWSLISFALKLPGLISLSNRVRRRAKGIQAVSRGMVAVGSGDARSARAQAKEAERLLGAEPLTLLLKAQAAQLSGERAHAEAAFSSMLATPETRVLGLRGLFVEANRKNDLGKARAHAEEAHQLAPTVPWASRSVLEYACADRDWSRAIAAVERNASRHVIAKPEARRLRAVLLTAQAQDQLERAPEEALKSGFQALKLEPGLVPAAVLVGTKLAEKGDFGKASNILEAAWKLMPHPDLGEAYLDVRKGDSALDRLKRARLLAKLTPNEREAKFTVARAALDAREFSLAREQLEELVLEKPTARSCLLMAELEDKEHGRHGPAREWLSRASRAPRDPVWMADGFVSESWAAISPLTGRIDAFEWRYPPQAIETSIRAEMDAGRMMQSLAMPPLPIKEAELEETSASSTQQKPMEAKLISGEGVKMSMAAAITAAKPTPIIFPVAHAPDDPGPTK